MFLLQIAMGKAIEAFASLASPKAVDEADSVLVVVTSRYHSLSHRECNGLF
jgi:hypothetical protein